MTTEDRLHPDPGESSAGGREGGCEPYWVVGLRQASGDGGEEGYLGGAGGICSSVGEVSMIRTSSRSM